MAESKGTALRCTRKDHGAERLRDDLAPTETAVEQKKVESSVGAIYTAVRTREDAIQLVLERDLHSHYLRKGLHQLSESYECLDASRPWLCYWIVHSLTLLDEPIPESVASNVCQFLARCQSPNGGFAGGPSQQPHLAPTYAAVNALCTIGTEEAYDVINREKLLEFLYSLKQPNGSFHMHVGGEVDVRCQFWEGGIGGVPGMEAHGGYTFCGLAALVILKRVHLLDMKSLLRWVAFRQMRFEGGFQGRCNKLVDGCYSFWQAGLMPLIHRTLHAEGDPALSLTNWMFDQRALQEYILLCCQCPSGGLLDKPGKSRDFYHTCYCLSGLSIAQYFGGGEMLRETIVGIPENSLKSTHPVYNIVPDKVACAVMHFMQKEIPDVKDFKTN